jgi:multiple sugar transport system permease protein
MQPTTVKTKYILGSFLRHFAVIVLAVIFFTPFLLSISTSLKTSSQVYKVPMEWMPSPFEFNNFSNAWSQSRLARPISNTLLITALSMAGVFISVPLVAFGFARIKFAGRGFLFMVLLSTMMLPIQITIIPLYVIYKNIGWLDTYRPLIVPAFLGGAPFFVFLVRQFFLTIPISLEDAATIDGCSRIGVFLRIFLPLSRPALAAIGIFAFVNTWNEYLRPLVFIRSRSKMTLTVALSFFRDIEGSIQYNLVMAAAIIAVIPCLAVFLSAQRFFIQGISTTGMKSL